MNEFNARSFLAPALAGALALGSLPAAKGQSVLGFDQPAAVATQTQTPSTKTPPASAESQPTKAQLPPKDARIRTLPLVDQIFGAKIAAARTPAQKAAVAKEMLQLADQTSDDSAAKFMLLDKAKEIATAAGDFALANQAVDKMSESFSGIDYKFRTDALIAAVRTAKPEQIEDVLKLVDQSIKADDFDSARRLMQAAQHMGYNSREADKAIAQKYKDISAANVEFSRVSSALKTLKTDPNNAQANLQAGKYVSFFKADWEKGLPMLAKGGMQEAIREQKEGQTVGVADKWWDMGSTMDGITKSNVLGHSADIYRKVLPTLSGFRKELVEKRLASLAPKTNANSVAVGTWKSPDFVWNLKNDGSFEAMNKGRLEGTGTWTTETDGSINLTFTAGDIGVTELFRQENNKWKKYYYKNGSLQGVQDIIPPATSQN